jgi:hypothetical protein
MRIPMPRAAAVAALILIASPLWAVASPGTDATPDDGAGPPLAPQPFFHHGPGESGLDAFPGFPGLKSPVVPARPSLGPAGSLDTTSGGGTPDAPPAPPPKPPTRAEVLDRLMHRLAEAQDPDEAKGIATVVERMWMDSGSDTADLLMTRALAAMSEKREDVAAALLDKLIELRPGWAEAWNKRATLRFLDGDDTGSMEDISHVLALEPRHFGALSGMGYILERHGEDAAALKAMRRALSVYPGDAELKKAVDKLAPTVEGQDL